jgi:cellulose biosynthesis protein BcsQ
MSISIYAFYNNKGGVGKTTLCSNTATLYAEKKPKTQVLVIDMCPQAFPNSLNI